MISIKHEKGTFIFPVTPETFGPAGGDGKYEDVHVLKLGSVPFFDGRELKEYSWTSFFPAEKASYTEGKKVPKPLSAVKTLEDIKNTGEVVKLFIPDLKIKQDVQVRSFQCYQEKKGDIEYSIKLVEYREIKIETIKKKKTAKSNSKRKVKKASVTKPKTYTVKKGDCLSMIARKFGIKNWQELYKNNKKVVGSNPNLIYPGQVLKL